MDASHVHVIVFNPYGVARLDCHEPPDPDIQNVNKYGMPLKILYPIVDIVPVVVPVCINEPRPNVVPVGDPDNKSVWTNSEFAVNGNPVSVSVGTVKPYTPVPIVDDVVGPT